jgi:hypothetical protein
VYRGHKKWAVCADSHQIRFSAGGLANFEDNARVAQEELENRAVVTKEIRAPNATAKLMVLLHRYSVREVLMSGPPYITGYSVKWEYAWLDFAVQRASNLNSHADN